MHARFHQPERDIGNTSVKPALARAFSCAALLLLALVTAAEWRAAGLRALAGFRIPVLPTADDRVATWMLQPSRELRAALQSFERRVEDEGWLARRLIPPAQRFKLSVLRLGNESVVAGRDAWLYYRPDVDYVTGPGFLDKGRLLRRSRAPGFAAAPRPDPVPAIADFASQLRARGIELVVVPTPVKPEWSAASLGVVATGRIANASQGDFLDRLAGAGVTVFDPAAVVAGRYLRTDTHWTPEAVDDVARELARRVGPLLAAAPSSGFERDERAVVGRGDLVAMLGAGAPAAYDDGEAVVVREVRQGAAGWRADPAAEVLLLGDSFSNIYAQEGLGWGERGGLAEQLSFHLQCPVDRLVRNDAGSYATRDMLAGELRRGRDRLAGKKVVIWQFANRELAQGDWRLIPLELRPASGGGFLSPGEGEPVDARGVVAEISAIPLPGRVPYADHIAAVHLVDLVTDRDRAEREAYVFVWSMTNHVLTSAGRWRPGDEVSVRLRRWEDVAEKLESYNRSELAGDELLLAEPAWGEVLP